MDFILWHDGDNTIDDNFLPNFFTQENKNKMIMFVSQRFSEHLGTI